MVSVLRAVELSGEHRGTSRGAGTSALDDTASDELIAFILQEELEAATLQHELEAAAFVQRRDAEEAAALQAMAEAFAAEFEVQERQDYSVQMVFQIRRNNAGSAGFAFNRTNLTITGVTPGGAASQAGVRVGDIIAQVNGRQVESASEYTEAAQDARTFTMIVRREVRRAPSGVMAADAGLTDAALSRLPTIRLCGNCDDDCPICIDGLCDGQDVTVLPCLHRFHKACAGDWLKRKACCPCCKRDVEV